MPAEIPIILTCDHCGHKKTILSKLIMVGASPARFYETKDFEWRRSRNPYKTAKIYCPNCENHA